MIIATAMGITGTPEDFRRAGISISASGTAWGMTYSYNADGRWGIFDAQA